MDKQRDREREREGEGGRATERQRERQKEGTRIYIYIERERDHVGNNRGTRGFQSTCSKFQKACSKCQNIFPKSQNTCSKFQNICSKAYAPKQEKEAAKDATFFVTVPAPCFTFIGVWNVFNVFARGPFGMSGRMSRSTFPGYKPLQPLLASAFNDATSTPSSTAAAASRWHSAALNSPHRYPRSRTRRSFESARVKPCCCRAFSAIRIRCLQPPIIILGGCAALPRFGMAGGVARAAHRRMPQGFSLSQPRWLLICGANRAYEFQNICSKSQNICSRFQNTCSKYQNICPKSQNICSKFQNTCSKFQNI